MSGDPDDYESPRQRRERIFVRKRSRRRYVAIIAAAAVLFICAGIGFGLLRSKSAPAVSAEVPLIRADDQPTRKRPSDAGGMTVPDSDSLVLNRANPSVEQLLPPPETPLPRPTPPEPTAAEPTPPQAALVPPATTPPLQAQPEQPSAPPAAASTSPPPSAAPAEPERKTARAAAPPPPAPPANGKGYRLQLGSVRTSEAAKKQWDQLKTEQGDLLGSLGFTAERADLGARGIYYRIQAGPIADAAAAERSCNELKRRGVGCLLVKP